MSREAKIIRLSRQDQVKVEAIVIPNPWSDVKSELKTIMESIEKVLEITPIKEKNNN